MPMRGETNRFCTGIKKDGNPCASIVADKEHQLCWFHSKKFNESRTAARKLTALHSSKIFRGQKHLSPDLAEASTILVRLLILQAEDPFCEKVTVAQADNVVRFVDTLIRVQDAGLRAAEMATIEQKADFISTRYSGQTETA